MSKGASRGIALIGGGLGGSLLAVYLGRAGFSVDLYERRADPASGNMVGGRSINLAISVRGIHALEELGLAEEIMKLAIPMRGRMIHAVDGSLHFQPYDKDPSRHINSISRAGLNGALIEAARKSPNVRIHFNCKCVDVDPDAPAAEIVNTTTNERIRAEGEVVIGVDGAYSAVRRAMQRLDRFSYSQEYLSHGYKELCIPPDGRGRHRLEPNALHIWPRKSFMMIALPNPDGSFTCTLFLQWVGATSREGIAGCFEDLRTRDDVRRFFDHNFPDAVPLMPTLLEDFERNPTGSMATVRCDPWSHGGKVALVGDAAHAVVPFYGQGMNASFEDCTVLNERVRECSVAASAAPAGVGETSRFGPRVDWRRAFAEYEKRRKENADALADLAIGNFIEMRDLTGSRAFRAKKALERALHRVVPCWFTPLYTMVSFTRIPYAEAVRRARRQYAVISILAIAIGLAVLTALIRGVLGGRWVEAVSLGVVLVTALATAVRSRVGRIRKQARDAGARG